MMDGQVLSASGAGLALAVTQLNIVTLVDVRRSLYYGSLEGAVSMMDNSPGSIGKGTSALHTECYPGQVLNWLIYAMDAQQLPNDSWPPFPRIANIVFIRADATAEPAKVCTDLEIYGPPDKMYDALTPVYDYWAGVVLPDLSPGLYRYRLIIECDAGGASGKHYFNLEGPALRVIKMDLEAASSS